VESITSSKLFTTRQGTVLLGVIAAIIAAVALIVYLNHYRKGAAASTAQVLVAQRLIQKGTSGDLVQTSAGVYKLTSFPKDQLKTGAISDPAALSGTVALIDIAGGQQLTSSDFGPATSLPGGNLKKNERAVVIPLGSPETVGGQAAAGSHVDVWVALNGTNRLLFQNMYVLTLSGENVTLKTNPEQAVELIQASQTAQVWLVLRPTVGTIQRKPPVVTPLNLTAGR